MSKDYVLIEERLQELEYVDDWKTLVEGIKYRRVGTDVEININYTKSITFQNWQTINMSELPERI